MQPKDGPLFIVVRLTNTGKEPFTWWCGGPQQFPAAMNFHLQLRQPDGAWKEVDANNGQYTMGSGGDYGLIAGESIEAPLAFEAPANVHWVHYRVQWADSAVCSSSFEGDIELSDSAVSQARLDRHLLESLGGPQRLNSANVSSLRFTRSASLIGELIRVIRTKTMAQPQDPGDAWFELTHQSKLPGEAAPVIAQKLAQGRPSGLTFDLLLRTNTQLALNELSRALNNGDYGVCKDLCKAAATPGDSLWLRQIRDRIRTANTPREVAKYKAEAIRHLEDRIERTPNGVISADLIWLQ